jgi:hypothetical protein
MPLGPVNDREACRCLSIRSERLVGASNSRERLVGNRARLTKLLLLFEAPKRLWLALVNRIKRLVGDS